MAHKRNALHAGGAQQLGGVGRIVLGVGWFDVDYLGIDQGPIVAMIENHRSELIWKTMRKNPHIVRGLKRAGFAGGWLGPEDRIEN